MPHAHAECAPHPTTLAAMHNCYRVLLVFAPGVDNTHFQTQLTQLQADAAGFHERGLLLVPVLAPGSGMHLPKLDLPTATLSPEEEAVARQRYHRHPNFQTILLGKDGGEKLRSGEPLPAEKLYSTIDSMPMRQQEMQQPH